MMTRYGFKGMGSVIAVAFGVFMSVVSYGEIIDRVVAIVNEEVITLSELEREVRGRVGPMQSPSADMYRDILYGIVEQKLILGEAEELEISISEHEVNRVIERISGQNNISEEELRKALEQEGVTWEEYRRQIREDIMRNQIVSMKVRSQVSVTDKDLQRVYEEKQEEYVVPSRVRIEQVFFPVSEQGGAEERERVRERAWAVVDKARAGYDLETVVVDEGIVEPGESLDLGYFNEGELMDELDRAAFSVPVGEVSDVIETSRGYVIIRIVDRQEASVKELEDVRDELSEGIFQEKMKTQYEEWMEGLFQEAYIEIKL